MDIMCVCGEMGSVDRPFGYHDQFTALTSAAYLGHNTYINTLIKPGAGVNQTDINRGLMWASRQGNSNCIDTLIKTGADVNTHNHLDKTAPMGATVTNKVKCVGMLIKAGAGVNAVSHGYTALSMAAMYGGENWLRLLIEAGADVNSSTTDGQTALMLAAIHKK